MKKREVAQVVEVKTVKIVIMMIFFKQLWIVYQLRIKMQMERRFWKFLN
jgi:hypothetical protein